MAGAGLLGYLGRDVDPSRLDTAQCRAPWRGTPSAAIHRSIGGIIALGSAQAATHRHLAVAVHGRIDNLADVAREVDIDPEQNCAVLGEMYLRYGDGFACRLLGDFAILVLDERRGTLLGVRDWVAARPLFWGEHDGVTAFGSEVKQVLALLDCPYRLDEETAASYRVMGDLPITATFARGVQAIPPSGQVLATAGHTSRMSTRPVAFEPLDLDLTEAAGLIRSRLDTAVERRMQGAMRPCALISGGMDSTSVAATAALLAERGAIPPLVAGIGLHFPTVPQSDEIAYARDLAERWHIPLHPVAITPRKLLADPTEMLRVHDGPVYSGITMFDRMFAEARRQRADVLLTGQAGDYWQDQYYQELIFSAIRREWGSALTWLVHGFRTRPKSTVKQMAKAADAVVRRKTESEHYADAGTRYWIIRMAFEVEERLGQYHGLRVEFPFVDRELASAFVGISPRLRSRPGAAKLPLRAAMADRLPASILDRYDKSFFDPAMIATFGMPRPGQTTAQMVAESYLLSWRRYLAGAYRPIDGSINPTWPPAMEEA